MTGRDPTHRGARRGQAGFTLLELIVAAGILALIAVFSWRGLDALIREREGIAASQATIDVLQRSFARIERDALLAGDAQVDEDGTMRLAAGTAPVRGAPAATVEYRLLSGALTRRVIGLDQAPQVMMEGVATLSVEAWTPASPPRSGAWVRVKAAASEAPPPVVAVNAGASANGVSTTASSFSAAPVNLSSPNNGVPTAASNSPAASAALPRAPVIPAATGIRLSLARLDGSRVVRSFVVGGG